MNILDTIINAQDGAAVRRLGSQLGLGDDQTAAALSAVIPALAAGLQRNMQSPDGLTRLSQALATGQHQSYLDDPSLLGDPSTVTDGNGILGHLLGSKDVSRGLAANAAAQTGVSAEVDQAAAADRGRDVDGRRRAALEASLGRQECRRPAAASRRCWDRCSTAIATGRWWTM